MNLENKILKKVGLTKVVNAFRRKSQVKLPKQSGEDYLPKLLREIETQKDPKRFKETVLRTIQLYFDGLIEQRPEVYDPEIWTEQSNALNAILKGLQLTVSGFYRNPRNIHFSKVKEIILPFDSTIVKYGLEQEPKTRHLYEAEYEIAEYAEDITRALARKEIDLIMPIASGGFEPALLTADYIGVNSIFPVRYSWIGKKDDKVLIPNQAPEDYSMKQIKGKKVLVVDDLVCTAKTAIPTMKWVVKHNPAKMYFAVVREYGEELADRGWQKDSRYLYTPSIKQIVRT